MGNFYNAVIPRPAGIPETVQLRVFAERADGADLTPDELAALRAVYPAAASADAGVIGATPPSKAAKPSSPKASTKPRKATTKRAAAKRPSR